MGSGAQVCGVSGGPDWLFTAMLGGGLVAVLYGLVEMALLFNQGQPVREPGRSAWSRVGLFAAVPLLGVQLVMDPGAMVMTLVWAVVLGLPALATLFAVGRRAKATGVFPPARSAPYGSFWILLALSVAGVLVAATTLYAQFALGHIVPC